MSKPQPRRVPSDDCAVVVDSETYYPHEGEWIDVLGKPTVAEMRAFTALAAVGVQLNSAAGEPDEAVQSMHILDRYYGDICAGLAQRIIGWSWTDDSGQPLPDPRDRPDVFERLSTDEINYLVTATRGEAPAVRGNGSRPLPTTSSATAPRPMTAKRSTTGRNRTRVS